MPDTTKVKKVMVPITGYPVVYDEDTLKDAIIALKKYLDEGKEHRSLLVFSKTRKVNGEEELIGILTIRDILNAIKKNKKGYDNNELVSMSMASMGWAYLSPVGEYTNVKVSKVIRPLVSVFIQSDENVSKAIELMMDNSVNILPVFEGKKAMGIIRALDILASIGDML